MAAILPEPTENENLGPQISQIVPRHKKLPNPRRTMWVLISLVILGALALAAGYSYDLVNNNNQDKTRKEDLAYIASTLDGYHDLIGKYPTLAQVNSSTFGAFDPSLDRTKFEDPASKSENLSATPASGNYAYEVSPKECNNVTVTCSSYKLVAVLSNNSDYTIKSPSSDH